MLRAEQYKVAGKIAASEFNTSAVRMSIMSDDERRAEEDAILDAAISIVRRQNGLPENEPSPSAEVIREEQLRSRTYGMSWDER